MYINLIILLKTITYARGLIYKELSVSASYRNKSYKKWYGDFYAIAIKS